MDDLLAFEFLEMDYAISNTNRRRKRKRIRDECDPFSLEDSEFRRRYRLSKDLTESLIEDLGSMFNEPRKLSDLSITDKVLTALSFYATGSYQRPTGDIAAHSMAQQTVSKCIAQVTTAMNSLAMRQKHIVFPHDLQDRNLIRAEFYEKFGMPGVLGCVDGTHVAIVRPSQHEERYFCRKHYHSLNVQLICDANMYIYSVDASYGGATHDSFIWNQHPVKQYLENLNENTWLLGDSGYSLRKFMMTPVVNAMPNTPEAYYTEKQV
ncbi:putative nuclease HARBI1 [Plutella xylostella]|nr:putative nuclease HARBI1 [Plutella xylostella]XP_048487933.1 putative nuclease HARBI1 [Plutella xylostella]